MKFSPDRYKYYTDGKKVYAVSTYAGRTVKGVASCNEEDEFSFEKGKELAAARCDLKVAKKRWNRANRMVDKAYDNYIAADKYVDKMIEYSDDAIASYYRAEAKINELLETY